MEHSFKKFVDQEYTDRIDATASVPEVDAITFLTSSKYLDEKPFPFQSLVIKLLYGLWEKYPISPVEQEILNMLREKWGINIDLENRDSNQFVEVLILVIGRRGTKTSIISFVQTYETYKLICKGNPQKHYGIRARHPIEILNCAKDGEQAKSPFVLTKDNIKRIPFFQQYIDHTKDNESELRLFTPADLYENKKIREYNDSKPKGALKRNPLEGSILISAITTSAASKRGKATIFLCFDEFAHFDRAKVTSGGISDQDILTEMPQTDYAMFKALTPSVKDFHRDGKIVCISSPREKGGEFYQLYCDAGGREQPSPNAVTPNPEYLMVQLSTWEANPTQPESHFKSNFKKDPVGANMEYGGHFSDPSSTFIDPTKVDEMVDENKLFTTEAQYGFSYIIAVDPASKSDTYAVAWGHCEENKGTPKYHIDGVHGFRPKLVLTDGRPRKVPIDPEIVTNFIIDLAASLTRTGGHVLEIVYDQWNSSSCIFTLQKLDYPAFETMFTNSYKGKIYSNFLEKLNISQVAFFGCPPKYSETAFKIDYFEGWLEQTKLEIKYLQQDVQGNTTYYHAPTSGAVTTDDFADVVAQVVHRLALRRSPDRQTMQELYKQTRRPVKTHTGIRPVQGTSGFFSRKSSSTPSAIRNRVFQGRK